MFRWSLRSRDRKTKADTATTALTIGVTKKEDKDGDDKQNGDGDEVDRHMLDGQMVQEMDAQGRAALQEMDTGTQDAKGVVHRGGIAELSAEEPRVAAELPGEQAGGKDHQGK
ncbi:hypothetical protein FE257_001900 [Aspergillus nanangensis]|uniref:Uncharacterized protein n=1 Tax=Aspergillus nanangensis TaxID=2582783 RepID=A0AAD4GPC2_ASPNN|nr:hypothetical protein FE257_001900 [Aspergillus nanangensis]